MVIVNTEITFTQLPRDNYPDRKKVFVLDFLEECEVSDSWMDMTNTAKLKFPKNIYYVDENGNKVTWFGKNVVGGTTEPLLMRGDRISISCGYTYLDIQGNWIIDNETIFDGYVSKINPRTPIEIECEDLMWLLKQAGVADQVFLGKTYDVQKIIEKLLVDAQSDEKISAYIKSELKSANLSVVTSTQSSGITSTNVGDFRTTKDTIASVLDRFKKDYRLYSYFRNGELRCGGIVYYPQDRREQVFRFQNNIISDELEYQRKDDVVLGATAYSINKVELQTINASGNPQTKKKRLEVFVGEKGGDLRTLYYWNITDEKKLKEQATKDLGKFYYDGFKGKFKAFGLPRVRFGDAAIIQNPALPEFNGTFIIKSVTTTVGVSVGIRQDIELHYKIDGFTNDQINAGL